MNENINEKCKAKFEEIEHAITSLGINIKKLCEITYVELFDECESELEKERKHYEKYRKIFQRSSWDNSKATVNTLNALNKLLFALHKSKSYKENNISLLHPKLAVNLDKISEQLEKRLKNDDYL
jgi:uncharacterized protein (DUF39 family)